MAMVLPRTARMAASSSLKRSCPAKITSPLSMRPGGEGISRMMDSAVTLLPEPDSPTMATVSPASMSSETWSTAVSRPRSVLKRVVRLRTFSSGCGMADGTSAPAGHTRWRGAPSVAHLLLEILVEPHARIDRAGAHRTYPQLAAVVHHPGPPGRIHIRRRQPEVGRLVQDLAGHGFQHSLALALVALAIDLLHRLVVGGVGPER